MGGDIAGKAQPQLVEDLQRHQCNAGAALHVGRAASVDAAVGDISTVRVMRPVRVGVDRHGIDVAVENEGLAATRALARGDDVVAIAVAVLDRHIGRVGTEGILVWCPGIDLNIKAANLLFEPVGERAFCAHHAGDAHRLRHHLGQPLALGLGRREKRLHQIVVSSRRLQLPPTP